jgi:hypothetical protein
MAGGRGWEHAHGDFDPWFAGVPSGPVPGGSAELTVSQKHMERRHGKWGKNENDGQLPSVAFTGSIGARTEFADLKTSELGAESIANPQINYD